MGCCKSVQYYSPQSREEERIYALLHLKPKDISSLKQLFDGCDKDGSGEISVYEFLVRGSWRNRGGGGGGEKEMRVANISWHVLSCSVGLIRLEAYTLCRKSVHNHGWRWIWRSGLSGVCDSYMELLQLQVTVCSKLQAYYYFTKVIGSLLVTVLVLG